LLALVYESRRRHHSRMWSHRAHMDVADSGWQIGLHKSNVSITNEPRVALVRGTLSTVSSCSARDNLSARIFDFPSIHDVCGSTTTPKSCRNVTRSIAAPRARCEWKLDMSFASHWLAFESLQIHGLEVLKSGYSQSYVN